MVFTNKGAIPGAFYVIVHVSGNYVGMLCTYISDVLYVTIEWDKNLNCMQGIYGICVFMPVM